MVLSSNLTRIKVRERDNSACVLTKLTTQLEVTHIIPYSLGSNSLNFIHLTRMFAGDTVANCVDAYLSPSTNSHRTNINRLENLLTLSSEKHGYFGSCLFTLTSISDPLSNPGELRSYECEFRWVPRYHRPPRMRTTTQLLSPGTQLLSSRGER